MKAILFRKRGLTLVEKPRPRSAPGLALVRVLVAGICRTDIELWSGYYNFEGVAGHEFVGVVEEAPGRENLVGRRVTADINIGCGGCDECRRGNHRHCPDRRVIGLKGWDGAFAEYLVAPAANLYLVEDDLGDREAVLAEPLAAALRIADQVEITPDLRMAVLGDGKLGMLAALALRPLNPGLVLIGRHENRLALARDLGLSTETVTLEEDPPAAARRLGAFDLVVEATGRSEGISYALALVRPEGTIMLKTTSHQPSKVNLAEAAVREIKIIGSRCGDLGRALAFLKERTFDPARLIEKIYPFPEFPLAFQHARRPGAGKVLVDFPPP
ncbi:MAG: alcohol dehydrogenase catalytic domain-containing protein [Thermodesulfobacteriota bacterium]